MFGYANGVFLKGGLLVALIKTKHKGLILLLPSTNWNYWFYECFLINLTTPWGAIFSHNQHQSAFRWHQQASR
jgi:hypothetical protein